MVNGKINKDAMWYMSLPVIESVRDFAFYRHKNQKYGRIKPYSYHLNGVAINVLDTILEHPQDKKDSDYIIFCVSCAYLHDIVEDYDYTKTSLKEVENRFGSDIASVIRLLSHDKNEMSYADYIRDIGLYNKVYNDDNSNCVVKVKLADLAFNIEQGKKEIKEKYSSYKSQRLQKYELARLFLQLTI